MAGWLTERFDARLDQLLGHHRRNLDLLISHLALPQRVVDVFTVLFKRPISGEPCVFSPTDGVFRDPYRRRLRGTEAGSAYALSD